MSKQSGGTKSTSWRNKATSESTSRTATDVTNGLSMAEVKKLPFERRVKFAMDAMMQNSTSIGMAVSSFSTDANDAIRMMEYIRKNL